MNEENRVFILCEKERCKKDREGERHNKKTVRRICVYGCFVKDYMRIGLDPFRVGNRVWIRSNWRNVKREEARQVRKNWW